jgi:hypothetical protein
MMNNILPQTNAKHSVDMSFDHGYNNAVKSFNTFTNTQGHFQKFHDSLQSIGENSLEWIRPYEKKIPATLLSTDVFGEWVGKSYLIIDQLEFEWLTRNIKVKELKMQELIGMEFLKELDNIISAAVISKVSDSFNTKIYGDIPIIERPFNGDLFTLIKSDFGSSEKVYLNAGCFRFEGQPNIFPLFVWAMKGRVI